MTTDHLGSPRIITNDEKEVVSRHDYLAFGDEVTNTVGNVAGRTSSQGYGEVDEIRKQYTGYERDKESGLDFAQARYYNSKQGRFTSVDPLTSSASIKNPQTFNRYSYVLNSPYKFVDPLGLISRPANEPWCSTCFSGWGDYDEEQEIRKKQEQQRTKSTAEQDDAGTGKTVNRDWFVRLDGTKVNLSDDANKALNEGAQAIRDNIVAAMSAVEALQKNPVESSSISFTTSVSDGGGNIGVTMTVSYSSKDTLLKGLIAANDKLQTEMFDSLEEEKFSSSNNRFKGKKLGEVENRSTRETSLLSGRVIKKGSSYSVAFAQYARTRANVFARNRYNKIFSNREPRGEGIFKSDRGISSRRYPKVFDKDH